MRCVDIERLLPEYLDETLSVSRRRSVEEHLQACAGCGQELTSQRRALMSLERVSLAPAPDLWQAFSQRMAAEITCREVRESLPGYPDGALGATLSVSIHNHLRACAECAVEAEKLAACLDTLERVGELPQVDLWAAFAERQAAEARRPVGLFSRLAAALRTAWYTPGFQPVLSLGVLALCVVTGRQFALTSQPDSASYSVALERPVEVVANAPIGRDLPGPARVSTPERPEAVNRLRGTGEVPQRTVAVERPRFRRPVRVARAEVVSVPVRPASVPQPARKAPEPLLAAAEEPAKGVWTSQLQVSYNMSDGSPASGVLAVDSPVPSPAPAAAPKEGELFKKAVVVNSGRAQAEVMPEVVEAVRLLAGIEDASRNPFRTEADGH